jgi:hypothetical protein
LSWQAFLGTSIIAAGAFQKQVVLEGAEFTISTLQNQWVLAAPAMRFLEPPGILSEIAC